MTSDTLSIDRRLLCQRATVLSSTFTKEDLVGKEFQLEEREDQDSGLTELWLQADGTIKFGQSDGPPTEKEWGVWAYNDGAEKPLFMEIIRTYKTAEDKTGANQVGEFEYEVKREFWGNLKQIGNIIGAEGTIHGDDEAAAVDCEVGYFSLIDEAAAESAKVE